MHKLWLLASTAGKGLLQCVLIVALTFLFCRTIPGDAVDVLGLEGGLTAEQAAAIRQALKLDDPWLVQFGDWLSAASRGDLGQSLRFGRSVSDMLLNAIPVTLQLAGWAFVLGLFSRSVFRSGLLHVSQPSLTVWSKGSMPGPLPCRPFVRALFSFSFSALNSIGCR